MQRVLDAEIEQVRNIYQGSVLAPFALAKALLLRMLERGSGALINMVPGSRVERPPGAG